ncbi:MAG: TonB-dependent receptor, partial [Sphingomonadales bacterium]
MPSENIYKAFRQLLFCGAAFVAVPIMAQTPGGEELLVEEDAIVVTGSRPIAESEAAALVIQKNSDSLVTVAASDSVGRLPDQNIAQAAGRLPGLAVERDQGQARYLS